MSTQEIYNARQISELLTLSGQPTTDQLKAAAEEGFKVVINLATINPRYSLEDEAGLVGSLGMKYHHIPVEWENPTEEDFEAFEQLFKQVSGQRTLVHCAANYRVSAFYSLYGMKNLGWSEKQADEFRASVWDNAGYPIWEAFIDQMKAIIKRDAI